jgi:error-prone DNA polymerase
VHYNCHTCFSLRYGVFKVDQLIDGALDKGLEAIAVTDINNTSAALDFVMKARAKGLRPIVGIEFRIDNRLIYIGLARNAAGFRQLNTFLSEHLHRAALVQPGQTATHGDKRKQAMRTTHSGPEERDQDLIAEGPGSVLPTNLRELDFPDRAPDLPDTFFIYPFEKSPAPETLRDNEFIGVKPIQLNKLFTSPCKHFQQKLITFLPVTFPNRVGYNTHRLLRAIDRNIILSKQDPEDVAPADEVLHGMADFLQFYKDHSYMVTNTMRLMEQCEFEMTFDKPKNKLHFTGSRHDDRLLLEKLAFDGLQYRYGLDNKQARARVENELQVIDRLGFSAYFLITWDFIRYGQARGFFHVGRGSGANSIVAYCMGITDVDPIDLDLYFERFLNPHRTSPPDFDIDFSWTDRDEVIDYVFKRYGHSHTSLMATYNTFKGRSILRELGKVFGLPKEEIDNLVATRHSPSMDDKIVQLIYRYGRELEGLPNHLGIHPGGILITEEPVYSFSATALPPKGFPIVQFDMFVAEEAGLYKYDVLSQRGLGHIKTSYEVVRQNRKVTVDVHDVKAFKQDPKIAALLRTGRTIGCFYVESPAMRQLLRKLRCDDYITLVAASSVIRPGVAKSGMMRQYIERHLITTRGTAKRKQIPATVSVSAKVSVSNSVSEEVLTHSHSHSHAPAHSQPIAIGSRTHTEPKATPAWYLHPSMADYLGETYGVMVYQEDVIKVAHYFGGVDLGEADILRRAMSGKYRSANQFNLLKEKFFGNCRSKGIVDELTGEVWRQMESFSGYSFCKAHSASYAVESYQSLFFKAHFPLEFMVGVINNFGGFYRTEVYLHEARMAGANVLAPCVNHSTFITRIAGKDLWMGFVHMAGLERQIAEILCEERAESGPFSNLENLLRRVPLGLEQASLLIRIGALRFTGKSKKKLLWEANMHFSKAPEVKQKTALFAIETKEWQLPDLPDDPIEDCYDQIEILGFPLCSPFDLLSEKMLPDEAFAADLETRPGQRVTISGYLISTKQVRTSRGDMMGFVDFVDAKGEYFDATMFPDTFMKYPILGIGVYRMKGRVSDDFGVPTLEVESIWRLGYLGDPRRG